MARAGYTDALGAVFRDPVLGRMLGRVEEMLRPVDRLAKSGASIPFRSRYRHSVRVLGWALRLSAATAAAQSGRSGHSGSAVPGGDRGRNGGVPDDIPCSLAAAAIFHDAGYAALAGDPQGSARCHAKFSEEIFVEYAKENGLYAGRGGRRQLEEIAGIIAVHSDKALPNDVLTADQQILMDADLLDEAGAMRFAWICFREAGKSEYDYGSAYALMRSHLADAEKEFALLHTEAGRAAGGEMLAYLRAFADGFRSELQLRPR
jgi:hypothetical protein